MVQDERVQRILQVRTNSGTNPFLLAFLQRKHTHTQLTWAGFVAPYKDLEAILLSKDILVEAELSQGIAEDERYGRIWTALRAIKYSYIPDAIVDHDASNFLLVHRLRERHADNLLFGPSVWLLTRDSTLRRLDESLRAAYNIPHSQSVTDWGARLLPLQNIQGFIAGDFVGHLLQCRFGIIPESDGVDLDFLQLLSRIHFDLETILDLEPDHAAQVLVDLQKDEQARELVNRASAADTETARVEVTKQLADRTIELAANARDRAEQMSEELEQRLEDARAALRAVEDDNRSLRIATAQLEKKVDDLSKRRGILSRLASVFRPARSQHAESRNENEP